jgi:hypothetical protein
MKGLLLVISVLLISACVPPGTGSRQVIEITQTSGSQYVDHAMTVVNTAGVTINYTLTPPVREGQLTVEQTTGSLAPNEEESMPVGALVWSEAP